MRGQLFWATWVREYINIYVNIDGHFSWGRVILPNLGQRVNEMIAVTVNFSSQNS